MNNHKVVLISLYSDVTNGIPPLGPLYLATALIKRGFEVKIIHKNESNIAEIRTEIDQWDPILVGMSVFTGYLNEKYVRLSKELKRDGRFIVWGNAHASLLPREVLSSGDVDFVVVGEGEETIIELAEKIGQSDSYQQIRGLAFKNKSGEIIINQRREYVNIDDYLIDWSLINVEEYLVPYFSNKYSRTLAVVTSRGCPFNCQFCYNLVFNNRRWRGHSADKLIANLKPIIEKYHIDAIRFLDDNFFVDKGRALQIVRGLGLPYFADARVEYIDESFVADLKATQCREIMFGFESGSDRILKEVVQKGTGTKDIVRAVSLLNNSGIMASGSIVFGFPTETQAEYRSTMDFIVKLLEINNNLAFTCGWFLPYPGTGLYEKAKELGFCPPQDIADWDRFDRWRSNYEMEWIKWDYYLPVKYSRKLVQLLALSYKRNIGWAKVILRYRAKHGNFFMPVDIFLLSKLRAIYMFYGEKNIFHRFIKKIITRLMR